MSYKVISGSLAIVSVGFFYNFAKIIFAYFARFSKIGNKIFLGREQSCTRPFLLFCIFLIIHGFSRLSKAKSKAIQDALAPPGNCSMIFLLASKENNWHFSHITGFPK